MAKQQGPKAQPADPAEMAHAMAEIAERSQRLVAGFLERQQQDEGPANLDPLNVGGAFMESTLR